MSNGQGDSGRGFTRGNMDRENEYDRNSRPGLYEAGQRPGFIGEFQECTPQGDLLDESTRIVLDYDNEPLPDTSQKNNKWKVVN
ncbi:hypothetical protein [Kushneria aurantia]|uniref:Uncharacterized protein n=1 Tax=Kushneria aurantia TaxID=504092 RepID=A0ABV6G3X6_9GAMM|nr:hypothetical protein [Kushneria aurantia]